MYDTNAFETDVVARERLNLYPTYEQNIYHVIIVLLTHRLYNVI